jgi:rubrerythrin
VTIGATALLLFWHSQWYCAEFRIGQAVVITSKGRVSLAWSESPRLFAKFSSFTFRFEPAWSDFSYRTARYMPILTQHNSNSAITFPLWTLATLLIPGILLLYFPRPLKPNHCPHCRYNHEGLPPNSPCPECGKPVHI